MELIQPTELDLKTEMFCISGLINDGGYITEVAPLLQPKMLVDAGLRKVYAGMLSLYEANKRIDLISLSQELVKKGGDPKKTPAYLTNLMLATASGSRCHDWAVQIVDAYMRREFNALSIQIVAKTADPTQDITETLDFLNKKTDEIIHFAKIDGQISSISEVTTQSIAEAIERKNSIEKGVKMGVSSGITDLDHVLGGFKSKKLIILAARPGMGKTSLAVSFVKKAALQGHCAAFFSLEMPREEVSDKLLLSECDVMPERYRDGYISGPELDQLQAAKQRIDRLPIKIDDTASLTFRTLKSRCIILKKKYDVKLIVIDYIQLLIGSKDRNTNREQEIAQISRGLKEMAKELEVTIIALAQLNRDVEKTAEKMPMLSHLRESGSIEQDADVVMFAYRPEYYGMDSFPDDPETSTKGIGRILVSKHRGGSCGGVYFSYDKAMNKIGNKLQTTTNIQNNDYNFKTGFRGENTPF